MRPYCCGTAPEAKRRPSALRHHDRLVAEGRGLAGAWGSRGSATFLSAQTVLAIKPRGGIIAAELRLRNIAEPCTLLCQEWLEVRGCGTRGLCSRVVKLPCVADSSLG